MDARTVNNLPPAATHDGATRCLIAIELSKRSWVVAANTPLSEKISRYTLKACDAKGLLELIEKIRTRIARELKQPVEVISCYEAGYDGLGARRSRRSDRCCVCILPIPRAAIRVLATAAGGARSPNQQSGVKRL